MKYERTQKGNPHQLTIKQHYFPTRSIARFGRPDGTVEVWRHKNAENFRVRPDDSLFCARRSWDQRAESGFMRQVEGVYQELADGIVDGNVLMLCKADHAKISDMHALWNIRWIWGRQPIRDQPIEGAIGVETELTLDDQEFLEKTGITPIPPELTISGRSLTGIKVQREFWRVRKQMCSSTTWGILKSKRGEFLVPDNSCKCLILPVAPQICLLAESEDREIEDAELARINSQSIRNSSEYYFARDLSQCPR